MYRHGDLILQPIQDVDLKNRIEVLRTTGLVLRHGTATGNAHVISDGGARLYEPGDVPGTRLLVVDESVQLEHPEHMAITLPPGSYRVSAARQGEDESWGDVQD
jgi:hypothetical protein